MKRILSYSLFITMLILSVAAMGANVWEENVISCTQADNDTVPLENNKLSFTTISTPIIPTGLTNGSNSRLPIAIAKAEYNRHYMRNSCFSQLTHQQLSITEFIYISLFAKKQGDGYYIYALRKLLI